MVQKEKNNKKIANKRPYKEESESEEKEENKPAEVESEPEEIVEEKVKKTKQLLLKNLEIKS